MLTLLTKHVVAKSTSLWASSRHPEDISKWICNPWSLSVCGLLSKHPQDLIDQEVFRWDPISQGPPASISSSSCNKSTPGSKQWAVRMEVVAYSLSGTTLSDPSSVCSGLRKKRVLVFPPGEEGFMEKAKAPPPGLGPVNMFCSCGNCAENGLSPNQQWGPGKKYLLRDRQSLHRHSVPSLAKVLDHLAGFLPAKSRADVTSWFPPVSVNRGLPSRRMSHCMTHSVDLGPTDQSGR